MGTPTNERNRALTAIEVEYARRKAANGGRRSALLPVAEQPALTEERARSLPVTIGVFALVLAGLLCLGGWALTAHNTSAIAHPNLQARDRENAQHAKEQRAAIIRDLRELTGLVRKSLHRATK